MPAWEKLAAKTAHFLLFTVIILMPISGLIMSVAAGYPPSFFGLFEVPQFIAKNESISGFFFNMHAIVGNIAIGIIGLHILAALKHHFIDRNNILKRMLPWG